LLTGIDCHHIIEWKNRRREDEKKLDSNLVITTELHIFFLNKKGLVS